MGADMLPVMTGPSMSTTSAWIRLEIGLLGLFNIQLIIFGNIQGLESLFQHMQIASSCVVLNPASQDSTVGRGT